MRLHSNAFLKVKIVLHFEHFTLAFSESVGIGRHYCQLINLKLIESLNLAALTSGT